MFFITDVSHSASVTCYSCNKQLKSTWVLLHNSCMITLRNLLLWPFYISYNTCISILLILVMLCFIFFVLCFSQNIWLCDTGYYVIKIKYLNNNCGLVLVLSIIKYVRINNVNSNPNTIQCGVPQGSILPHPPYIFSFRKWHKEMYATI